MNAKDFVIKRLEEFLKAFKDARVRYEHDSMTQTHIVDVCPQAVFDSQEFLDWECKLYDQFLIDYPGEVIGFISENALVGIENVDFELEGSLYGSYTINPDIVFNTPVAKISLSATRLQGETFSVSDIPLTDNFEETLVSNNDFLNNYKFAA